MREIISKNDWGEYILLASNFIDERPNYFSGLADLGKQVLNHKVSAWLLADERLWMHHGKQKIDELALAVRSDDFKEARKCKEKMDDILLSLMRTRGLINSQLLGEQKKTTVGVFRKDNIN